MSEATYSTSVRTAVKYVATAIAIFAAVMMIFPIIDLAGKAGWGYSTWTLPALAVIIVAMLAVRQLMSAMLRRGTK